MLQLFKNASEYVSNIFQTNNSEHLTYNTYYHTQQLLKRANGIIDATEISATEASIIQLAILFSKTGYTSNYQAPFDRSIHFAKEFFKTKSNQNTLCQDVIAAIEAIKAKQPKNDIQSVVVDVYYSDYGQKKYLKQNSLLRKELERKNATTMTDQEWLNYEINTLASYQYTTDYAQKAWEGRKRKNLAYLLNQQKKLQNVAAKEKTKAYYKQKYKNESPERGIQTLYRIALRNHIKLSDIADTKANILLSVNAIIISLVISNLLSKLDNPSNRYLIFPTIVFVVFSIISMVMSIKATQPNVTKGEFTDKDLKARRVNLAFFGNFHQMELERYQQAFKNLIKNKDSIYETLTKDLYFLGSVLNTKYRLLRYTYLIFMVGIIISVIAFTFSFIYRNAITL